eukprot:c9372_g1_i2 orf=733-1068(+)
MHRFILSTFVKHNNASGRGLRSGLQGLVLSHFKTQKFKHSPPPWKSFRSRICGGITIRLFFDIQRLVEATSVCLHFQGSHVQGKMKCGILHEHTCPPSILPMGFLHANVQL